MIRRREFVAGLGSAAVWPHVARAQQRERIRRIGLLTSQGADDPVYQTYIPVLLQALQELGWTVGRNVQFEPRWGAVGTELKRRYAAELVALVPDVILTTGDSNVGPLLQETRIVPIVFVSVPDPVGSGFVASLARPGGNATGFTNFEFGLSVKWPELLKQIAPGLTRVAVLRDPSNPAGIGQWAAIQAVAPQLRLVASPIDVRNAGEIERGIGEFARTPNGALIVLSQGLGTIYRKLIIALAARHQLPAVYPYRNFVAEGGLIAYGPDQIEQYRGSASYIDRILKGEKPADLPAQAPTKFEMAVNLKTAKALGLNIPASIYAIATEVIE